MNPSQILVKGTILFWWPIRFILRLARDFDGFFTYVTDSLFRTQSPFKLTGGCTQRGVCCRKIAIFLSPTFWRYPWVKKLAIHWYSFVYSFTYTGDLASAKFAIGAEAISGSISSSVPPSSGASSPASVSMEL